jgi:hypothetical protein
MNKTRQALVCLAFLLVLLSPTVEFVSVPVFSDYGPNLASSDFEPSALTPLAAGTFPVGTLVVPMDNRQADRVRVYGLMHEFLRTPNAEVARVIEPPDVTLQTSLTPSGAVYQGGPFLIDQRFLGTVNSLLASSFSGVTVTRLTAPFTSNKIFFVRQPTKILVIQGIWGRTDYTLSRMGINYTLVSASTVENNPSLIDQYSLIVVDCPGWYGDPTTFTADRRARIQAVYNTISTHVKAGNEVIYTDIAIRDLNATFPGYVNTDIGAAGTWTATVYNPPKPAGQFPPEYPSQYYNSGANPNTINIVTAGGGTVVSSVDPAHASDVRILIDTNKFGVPYRYAILAFYFQFGDGIVEGLAFHPQEQLPVGSNGFYAVQEIYGNKFVHGPQVDFTISITPPSTSINQGQIANYTVTVTSIGSFSSPVNLQASGIPGNSTSAISPSTVTPPPGGSISSTLQVFTHFNTPKGNYSLTVTGVSALPEITRFTTANLTVNLTAPDFIIDANPKLVIENVSTCRNVTVAVTGIGTFNSPVNLTINFNHTATIPRGVTYKYIPGVVTPPIGGTVYSTLQVCAGPDATPSNYTVTIIGTGSSSVGTLVHTVDITLRIQQPVVPLSLLIILLVLLLLLLAIILALLALFLSRKRRRAAGPLVAIPARRAKPRVQYVIPLPYVRCRNCGRMMPLHAVYCPYCGRPQVILAPPPRTAGGPGGTRLGAKGILGFVFSLIAGILVILNSAALLAPSFYGPPVNWSGIFFWIPIIGQSYAFALGFIIGLVMVMGSVIMVLRHGALADIIIFPFAIFSLIIGGGFLAGMVLGVVGGIIGALKR